MAPCHDGWVHTILIVDDNAGFRRQARAVLSADGFDVVGESADGAAGLAAARALRPDVLLLDIGLPDVEGFDVARELAADGPPPLVVLTSSRDASAYGPRLSASPVLGFIPKDELSGAAIRALVSGA
jgi:DNA-binding NarL/FixJ family response regulator